MTISVKTIFTDKTLRAKLLWRLMTFSSVQLLFDKLKPYVFNAFVFQNLLVQKFFETYGICMTAAETLSKKFPNKTKIYSDLTRLFFFCGAIA
jgi:hypothetical protein